MRQTTVVRTTPTPATEPSSTSPRCTAATPAGVPVKIRSPGARATKVDKNRDRLGHAPDELAQIARLPDRAVHPQFDRAARGVEPSGWHQGADRGGGVETLAHVPWPAGFLGFALQIAPGHVEPGGVAPYVSERPGSFDIAAARANCRDEFHFMMQISGLDRVRHVRIADQKSIGGLHEEKRRLAIGVVAHLPCMLRIVAAHAKDAPDGEQPAALYRHGRLRRGWDDVLGHGAILCCNGVVAGYGDPANPWR